MSYKLLDDVVIIRKEDVEGGDNAFSILAAFKAEGRNQRINRDDIDKVIKLAMAQKSYQDLIEVIKANSFYAV